MLAIDKYKIRDYNLNIKFFSLSQVCIDYIKPYFEECAEELKLKINISKEILFKSKLKKYSARKEKADCGILIHREDGRLLLTDKNGIYDKFIKEILQKMSKKINKKNKTENFL